MEVGIAATRYGIYRFLSVRPIFILTARFDVNQYDLGSDSAFSSVQYIDTEGHFKGASTDKKGRDNAGGECAARSPAACTAAITTSVTSAAYNVDINTRRVETQVAVQDGDTIMLAGLIDDSTSDGSNGLPLLSKLHVVGALFWT